jgi:hypothetical protein
LGRLGAASFRLRVLGLGEKKSTIHNKKAQPSYNGRAY